MILPLLTVALAANPRTLPTGTTVKITDVARKDAFWRFRAELIGDLCVVGDPGLVRHHGKWYGGAVTCSDGTPYYFYQVAVEVGDYDITLPAPISDPTPPEEGPLDLGALFPTPSAEDPPEWPVGRKVRIRAISTSDATYERKPSLVGLECAVADAPLQSSGGEWFSGSLTCGDQGSWFFFQVGVDPLDAPKPTRKADGRLTEASVSAGRRVRIVDVATVDMLSTERKQLTGLSCTVAEAPLISTGDGWYAGRLFCGEGQEYQFYQVSVAPL